MQNFASTACKLNSKITKASTITSTVTSICSCSSLLSTSFRSTSSSTPSRYHHHHRNVVSHSHSHSHSHSYPSHFSTFISYATHPATLTSTSTTSLSLFYSSSKPFSTSTLSSTLSPFPVVFCRSMANREQRNKDKENMKKKKEKRDQVADAKKKSGSSSSSSGSMSSISLAASEYGIDLLSMQDKMSAELTMLNEQLSVLQVGRATPAIFDSLNVIAHGQSVPLKALGSIAAKGAQTIIIQLYEPAMAKHVDKAIREFNQELNPKIEENAVIVNFPKVTREIRDGIIKQVHKKAEDVKGHIRAIRQKYLGQLKSVKMSEDLVNDLKKEIQEETDRATALIKKAVEDKEKEVNTV